MDENHPLNRLDVYLVAVQLADYSRKIHERMNLSERIINGDQFIRCVYSIGANIAEGYGRYHYLALSPNGK